MQTRRTLSAKLAAPDADHAGPERKSDERVYRLHGVTACEIKLVEEGAK